MTKRNNEHLSLSDALKGFIKENNLQGGLEKINARDAWFAVMGNAIKAYTDSVELKNNVLIVRLSSSVLRNELDYGKTKIITNINEYLRKDVIKEIILT